MKSDTDSRVEKCVKWRCAICGEQYKVKRDAVMCFHIGIPDAEFVPGEIVCTGTHPTGWIDGDDRWVRKHWPRDRKGQTDHHGFGFNYWFIVTAVGPAQDDPHTLVVTCETGAMSGKDGWRFQEFKFRNPEHQYGEGTDQLRRPTKRELARSTPRALRAGRRAEGDRFRGPKRNTKKGRKKKAK